MLSTTTRASTKRLLTCTTSTTPRTLPQYRMFGSLLAKVGYETLPEGIQNKSFYDLKAAKGKSSEYDFSQLKGKVVLIVNTASKCGFTPQYTGLQKIYDTYPHDKVEILGFPCGQFASQELANDEDIAEFCTLNHGVSFPLMAKSDVNGDNMNEVFAWLKAQKAPNAEGIAGTTAIKWNFTKFLVNQNGEVVGRFGSNVKPEALSEEIAKLLK